MFYPALCGCGFGRGAAYGYGAGFGNGAAVGYGNGYTNGVFQGASMGYGKGYDDGFLQGSMSTALFGPFGALMGGMGYFGGSPLMGLFGPRHCADDTARGIASMGAAIATGGIVGGLVSGDGCTTNNMFTTGLELFTGGLAAAGINKAFDKWF